MWNMELVVCVFFKQKTAYEMRISDWRSDVCSSDLALVAIDGFECSGSMCSTTAWGAVTDGSRAIGRDDIVQGTGPSRVQLRDNFMVTPGQSRIRFADNVNAKPGEYQIGRASCRDRGGQ